MRLRRTAKLLGHFLPPSRPADQVIGGEENPFYERWYLLPKNYYFNVMCHRYHRSDDDRASHDHPWWNLSFLVRGAFMEWGGRYDEDGVSLRMQGDVVYRRPEAAHRIELFQVRPVAPVTLFVTGPKVREWGFWCPKGWRHNRDFVKAGDDSRIGKGCD